MVSVTLGPVSPLRTKLEQRAVCSFCVRKLLKADQREFLWEREEQSYGYGFLCDRDSIHLKSLYRVKGKPIVIN